jgi:hypothetical protein
MRSIEKSIINVVEKYKKLHNGKSPSILLVPWTDLYDLRQSEHFNEKEGIIFDLKVATWYDSFYNRLQAL